LSGILAGAGGGSSSSLASPTWQSKRYPQKSGSLGSSGGGSEELAGCNAIGAESDMLGIWFWAWVWNGAASELRNEGVGSGGGRGRSGVGRRHLALAAATGYHVKAMSNSVNSLARGPIKWCGLRVTGSEC
jgi:hypothetical protein